MEEGRREERESNKGGREKKSSAVYTNHLPTNPTQEKAGL